jgi:hypothetical protein
MLREPKPMREIHKIQERLHKETEHLSDKELVAKIGRDAEAIKKKHQLRLKSKASIH